MYISKLGSAVSILAMALALAVFGAAAQDAPPQQGTWDAADTPAVEAGAGSAWDDAPGAQDPEGAPEAGNPEAVAAPYDPEADLAGERSGDADSYNPEAEPAADARAEAQPYNPEAEGPGPGGVPAPGDAGARRLIGGEVEAQEIGPGEPAAGEEAAEGPEPTPTSRGVAVTLDVDCSGEGVCREAITGLPFRILPRPFSNVYTGREADAERIVRANVRAFSPLYVFAREDIDLSDPGAPRGWYQVAESVQGPPQGWMQAVDVLEWKQALVVSYTHPGTGGEERQRVLMFRDLSDLEQVAESDIREELAVLLYDEIAQGRIPPAVTSKEPERFVHITRNFYMLPIVDFQTLDIDGDLARYLQIAAAVPQERGATTLDDPAYLEQSREEGELTGEAARALGVDMVFVMDMTRSMQPYIDRTKDALKELAQELASEQVRQKVRFGLVGYRDSVEKIPALEFTARNFTPELVDVDRFVEILEREAKASPVGSVDYAEEVFAGVEMGMRVAWGEDSLRFLILVGDASSHGVDHEQNTTGLDAARLRLAGDDDQIHMLAIHLLDPRVPDDHARAREQFSTLSRIRGSESSALAEVDTTRDEAFRDGAARLARNFAELVQQGQQGRVAIGSGPGAEEGPAPGEDFVADVDRASRALREAALVEYLGKEATPPKDIIVWALDRDLTNPAVSTLEVRVLVNREQLSSLIQALDAVLRSLQEADTTQAEFFTALQSVAGQTLKNPEAIGQATTLAESGLLPSFIASLPYESEVLALTDDMYASMTADQRAALMNSLKAKLQQYRAVNEQVDGWVRLAETDPEGRKVYPLHIDYLP